MYKRLLVPIGGSDTANLALREAIALAKPHDSTLWLLHVVDLTTAYSSVNSPPAPERQNALLAVGQKVVADGSEPLLAAGIPFDSKCITTFDKQIYDLIDEEAKSWPADLIVISAPMGAGVSCGYSWVA